MAFEEALHGMYDPRLKPRLLYSIMATHLPDERQPSKSPAQLSLAVSMIRRHHLLSEPPVSGSSAARLGGKTLDAYKAAVDAWIERLMILVSSTTTEKCWAGVCLLGVTCQECSRQRFLESYSSWFQKLLVHLKPTDPLFVRGAACASLTDLLTRLGALVEFTGVRREGTGLTAKLAQPVTQLLGEEGSNSIWNDGIDLLCTMLKFFPTSFKQHFSQVEALLVSKLMEADFNASLSEKFARCLALLPKSHGDAATWNSLIRRILLAINSHLDDAFAGMEDASVAKDAVAALVPRGQELPWLLGGVSATTNAIADGAKKFWQLLVPRISLLLQCCYCLLVNTYPVQVPVPLTALLALVTRILSVDGSPYRAASPLGVTLIGSQQASLCCELPALHSCALDLLYATLCGVRSQLLPRAADIVRLLTEYFRHCGSLSLRIKLYNISKHLLISMGVGMASALAPAIIDNALSDLKGASSVCSPYALHTAPLKTTPVWATGVSGWSQAMNPRKRKDTGNLQTDFPPATSTVDGGFDMNETASPVAVQIAALQAVEALLTVGGMLCPDRWRTELDSVVANVALNASAGALSPSLVFEEDISSMGGVLTFSSGAFQLAAYKAFLASLLSPCAHRPPFLSQGLSVFRKGRQEAGTEVAEFCAHALLALEPLIHPRSLPFASTTATMAANIATRRGPSDNLVSQIHRSGLQFQAGPGSVSTVPSATASHGYATQLAPSAIKVTNAGMHLEVEGDAYVHEDIESWIVDYGGDQNILNETSTMVVEGFEEGLQALDDTPRVTAAEGVANVSARQSAANDEDGLMMSIVGDMLIDPREDSRTAPGVINTMANIQMDEVNEAPSSHARQAGKSGASLKETDELSPSIELPPSGIKEMQMPVVEDRTDAMSGTPMQNDVASSRQDFVPGTSALTFSVAETRTASESDSDAIPDIVDGDPDTD